MLTLVSISRLSGTDETGVKRTGQHDICRPLDNSAAIGKQCDGVGAAAKAEQKVIGADVADVGMGAEPGAQSGKVHGPVVLMDLDGVTSAKGDVGTALAG